MLLDKPSDWLARPLKTHMKYYIWCFERQQWWLAGRSGYTAKLDEAGIYNEAEAIEICLDANRQLHTTVEEAMVPVETARARELSWCHSIRHEI